LGEPPLSYAELESLLARAPEGPTGILYFPYLAGSNSPHSDTRVRGAFVGLSAAHGRAELVKAVLEGTAYELEYVRETARQATGMPIDRLRIAGGGTRNRPWMQIKADVSGCRLDLLAMPETTLLGASLLAGIGAGVFGSPAEVFASPDLPGMKDAPAETLLPDPARHQAYARLYRDGYLNLQAPLRSLPLS
jgi:sugar (pentulose or hexulose) kinase